MENLGLLRADLLRGWKSSTLSDLVLVLKGKDQEVGRIQAHRCILAMRSEYFAALLGGNWKDTDNKELVIPLDDENCMNETNLQLTIEFIYTAKVTWPTKESKLDKSKVAWELMQLGRFFSVNGLEEYCASYIQIYCVDQDTVCEIWNTAHAWGCKTLALHCLQYLCAHFDGQPNQPQTYPSQPYPSQPYSPHNYPYPYGQPFVAHLHSGDASEPKQIWRGDGWDGLDKQLLMSVLQADELNAHAEFTVWKAVMKWVAANVAPEGEDADNQQKEEGEKQEMKKTRLWFSGRGKNKEQKEMMKELMADLAPHIRFAFINDSSELMQIQQSGLVVSDLLTNKKHTDMRNCQKQPVYEPWHSMYPPPGYPPNAPWGG